MSKRLAPKVGIASCVAVLLLLSLPYFLAPATVVGAYYGTIPVPVHLLDTLFALVAIIAFGSGLQNRSDPATVAGVTLALGAFMAVITLWWAVVTPADTLVEAARMDSLSGHRWAFALVTFAVPVSAGWYARNVL
ncbi:DUF7548 family protein [Haladaptatus cibarius]|uniref:DUF7548 family protein n=1 Tax=Haladaptatus cibarius TaxID=453847 RepID=UPI0006799908|nr:hypothetical protein [Haladaptatus cibarius]